MFLKRHSIISKKTHYIKRHERGFALQYNEIIKKLKPVLSEKRLIHSKGVSETASALAKIHNADAEKAFLAGILHDCAKMQTKAELIKNCEKYGIKLTQEDILSPQVLHGYVGAEIARHEYMVSDEEVLSAIRYHTIGRENMSLLEKIVFVADITEPNRKKPERFDKIRKASLENLDEAALMAYDSTLYNLIKRNRLIHSASIKGRNHLIIKKEKTNEKIF